MSEEPTYVLTLSESAINMIGVHLRRGAYEEVAPIINEMQKQCDLQDQERERKQVQTAVREAALELPPEDEQPAAA